MIKALLPIALSLIGTALLIPALSPLAWRIGWLDKPDARKQHISATPLTGGVAMLLTFTIAIYFANIAITPVALLTTMTILCLVGIWDDLHNLSARRRLVLQAGAALLMCWLEGLRVTQLGDLFGTGQLMLDQLSLFFTVFCVVGALNAVNMIDGVDGLAGGVVAVALTGMLLLAAKAGRYDDLIILLVLSGSLTGYLFYNMRHPLRKRASVFMGDAGSTMLGGALAWFLIHLSQPNGQTIAPAFPPIVGLWLVAVPVLDTLCLMLRRGFNGQSPFKADRAHLHHVLQRAGLSDSQTTLVIILMSAAIGSFGLLGWSVLGLSETVLFYAFVVLFGAYYYAIHHRAQLAQLVARLLVVRTSESQQAK